MSTAYSILSVAVDETSSLKLTITISPSVLATVAVRSGVSAVFVGLVGAVTMTKAV